MRWSRLCFFIGSFGLVFNGLWAQDSHYATYQYGTRSALMGGTVLGFSKDNTAIYYNAGSLAFVDSNSITLTANVYQLETYRISNATGNQKDLTSTRIGSVPLLVSGMFSVGRKNRYKIGYGVISPVNFNFKTTSRISGAFPVVADSESPGDEEFVGQSSISSQANEVAGMAGIGYRINPHWGIGLTNLLVSRTQDFSRSTYARFYLNNADKDLSGYSTARNVNYFHLRYLAKVGLCYRNKRFSAGFTVTAPSIGILGNGTVTADVIGTNTLYNDNRANLLANDRREELKATYKSPLSIATGANWTYHKLTFGLSAQYHFRRKIYTVMDPGPIAFVVPVSFSESLGSPDFLRLREGAKPVFNFGIGFEYALKRNLYAVTSFRTNNSFYDRRLENGNGIKTELTRWNLYHMTGGLILKQGHSQLSIGILYGSGLDTARRQNGEFSEPDETSFLKQSSATSKATYSSVGFLLGYSFLLFDISDI